MTRCIPAPVLCGLICCVLSCSSEPDRGSIGKAHQPIVGGVLDNDTKAHGGVVEIMIGYQGSCSGALIAANVVLTARHCVSQTVGTGVACDAQGGADGDQISSDYSPTTLKIFAGVKPDRYGTPLARGKKVFRYDQPVLCNKDIALILLDKSITTIEPMALRLNAGAQTGEKTVAIGYGLTNPTNERSSGQRYRLENVKVLSSGRDWNYLSGVNEFVTSAGACQGDSGGPSVSAATGAILGVASRVSDCISGQAYYSRVDMHAALIQQALKEAGAQAIVEGITVPTVAARQTGEPGCVTGAQCEGAACLGTAPKTYCSQFCSPGKCPDNMICKEDKIPIPGTDGMDQLVCIPTPTESSCDSCRYTKCKREAELCFLDKTCTLYMACMDACTTNACATACASKHAAGSAKFATFTKCACTETCGAVCTNTCRGIPITAADAGTPTQPTSPTEPAPDGASQPRVLTDGGSGTMQPTEDPSNTQGELEGPAEGQELSADPSDGTSSSSTCSVGNAPASSRDVFAWASIAALAMLGRARRRRA